MYILGISCYYHDAAAAILEDGKLIAAAAEERFSRKKHDSGFPHLAIEFCLEQAGIRADDLEYAVFYEKPLMKFERILQTAKKMLFADHHMSHAASAFFASPYDEAAIITVDGVGEWTTATVGHATADWGDGKQQNHIELFSEARFPHSLGLLYSAFTAYLGFEVNEGEYKVMGMAPFGEPNYVDQVYRLIDVANDGSFRIDMDYFSYHYSPRYTYNRKFVDLFGPERKREAEFFTPKTHPDRNGADARENQRFADVAASIQKVTEDTLIKMANYAYERTNSTRMCMAAGGALGAALYAWHALLNKPRQFIMETPYYGKGFTTDEVRSFLDQNHIPYDFYEDDDKLLDRTVDALVDGEVVGWFQGRFEWGPRALGSRSILADPRRPEMKQIVNTKIKFREPFRPFAPVTMEEKAPEFFEMGKYQGQHTPLFMLVVRPIPADKQDKIPAVTHVNGGGRLQAVRREHNPWYYGLVEKFGQATGVPVLLNTSYNLRGEPIVTTPQNAFNTFQKGALELLVMERFVVSKDKLG